MTTTDIERASFAELLRLYDDALPDQKHAIECRLLALLDQDRPRACACEICEDKPSPS